VEFRPSEDYLATNLANWNSRVPHHVAAYGLEQFRDDPAHLSSVVRFDLPRLGDLTGLDVVHLQCHIGSDTVSLARLGARSVTGLDFSATALEAARRLARDARTDVRFVQADVYSALDVLPAVSFDLVFTGIGALCWLPSVSRWAEIVASLLRRDGRLFIREGHPILWTLSDPRPDGLLVVEYPYFETAAGTEFHEELTYTPQSAPLASPTTRQWNHGIGEIFSAIAAAGLHIDAFEEHTSVPWNPLGEAMVETDLGEWVLRDHPERLPLTYTLQATRSAEPKATAASSTPRPPRT
jgi:SAM-dependent methyltransferase